MFEVRRERVEMSQFNRRRFLWMLGGSGGMAAAVAGARVVSATTPVRPWQSATRTATALGSKVSITALHVQQRTAAEAVEAAFAELETVESLLSIYRPDSQVSRLNRDGRLQAAHPYLLDVLATAQGMAKRSRGAFDITVQPLWTLYSQAARQGVLPSDEEVTAARRKIGWRRVQVAECDVRLAGGGTQITLNGIAQGFAADRAMAALREHGVEQALINTGEVGALGVRADGSPWQVGVQHPRMADAYAALAGLSGRCLATSGDYATRFADGFESHHLFDPRTGRSANELASVSVVAPTAMLADALSTAAFVMGPDRGLEFIQSLPECDALLIRRDGSSLVTHGFPLLDDPSAEK
jgi:FAD:protein FMN transferase